MKSKSCLLKLSYSINYEKDYIKYVLQTHLVFPIYVTQTSNLVYHNISVKNLKLIKRKPFWKIISFNCRMFHDLFWKGYQVKVQNYLQIQNHALIK